MRNVWYKSDNKKYIIIKYDKIEIRIHTESIHCIAIIHSKWTYFANSHSKRTFSKEEGGGRIQDDLQDKDMLENVGISS